MEMILLVKFLLYIVAMLNSAQYINAIAPEPEATAATNAAVVALPESIPSQLDRSGIERVLREAGWPEELMSEALSVSWGESRWSPGAIGDGGNSLGLFQLNRDTWSRYCGVSVDALYHPLTNAHCAYQVYMYDIGRGYRPWTQWSVKPGGEGSYPAATQ